MAKRKGPEWSKNSGDPDTDWDEATDQPDPEAMAELEHAARLTVEAQSERAHQAGYDLEDWQTAGMEEYHGKARGLPASVKRAEVERMMTGPAMRDGPRPAHGERLNYGTRSWTKQD